VPQDYDVSSAMPCLFIHSIYVIHCLYIHSLSVMLSRISFHVLYDSPSVRTLCTFSHKGSRCVFPTFPLVFQTFKTLCLLNYALMIRHDYDITSSLRRGALQLWYQSQMVNTRTDADLSAAVQNALQTLLPQIRAEICEEFRTSSGPSDAGGNPPPVTIHTWLEHFNKQKPHSFEKATAPVDAKNWISHMEKIFDVMGCEDAFKTRLAVYKFEGNALAWWKAYKQAKGGDAWLITVTWADFKKLFFLQFFPRAEQERLKREYHSIRQTNTESSTEFMQRFLRLAGFLGAAAGTEEEQAKNFQWGLRRSTLNHLMCMSYTDVAQVANVARNYEILHERDDDDAERPDKRQKSGDWHQPTTQQSSHRNHGHNNDCHGSDRRGGGDNHRSNNNYSGNNNRLNFKSIQSSSTHEHDPNITA
nr:zinc finger, CCHC-type, retrotransposon Gag domain protein [Tanacetum cinerariifolium]